jgi:hypothetical protein
VVSSSSEGIVLSDGYVLPPPPNVGLPSSGVWRDKAKMIVTHDSELPDRCIKCNAPALGPRLIKKLTWHHPALYLLLLVALLIALIVTLILRKTMIVELGLCDEHMKNHRRNVLITWGLIGGGGACILLAAMAEQGALVLVGMLLMVAGVIFAVVAVRIVIPTRINDNFAWIKGVNKDYLNALPQWPGP